MRVGAGAVHDHIDVDDAPILIGYDGSEGARHAIDVAAALLGPRRAIVLDIGPLLTAAQSIAVLTPVSPAIAFEEENVEDALARAREGAEHAGRAGFAAEARGTVDSPTWEAIVDAAAADDVAVIVLGTRGLEGARGALAGSVSHQVAEHAGRPVLIVPPADNR
jgi:nucleotide-binding universal stress UspA family protein